MNTIRNILLIVSISIIAMPTWSEDSPTLKVIEDYFVFAEYGGATILPEQIPAEDWKNIYVIDARDTNQFQKSHNPGAINIDWRQVLGRRSELPNDKLVLLYCNAGTLSAQAGLALRIAGMDNVRILQGGFDEWKSKGGFDAYQRATRKSSN